MFQPLKPINYKPFFPLLVLVFIFFRFKCRVLVVSVAFCPRFSRLPSSQTLHKPKISYLFARISEVMLVCPQLTSFVAPFCLFKPQFIKCPLIILNIATFYIVCSSIWTFKKVVVTAQSIPCVPIPHGHLFCFVFFSFLKPKKAPLYWYFFSLFRSCYPSQGGLCNNFAVR